MIAIAFGLLLCIGLRGFEMLADWIADRFFYSPLSSPTGLLREPHLFACQPPGRFET